jgi:hypothetical protein
MLALCPKVSRLDLGDLGPEMNYALKYYERSAEIVDRIRATMGGTLEFLSLEIHFVGSPSLIH